MYKRQVYQVAQAVSLPIIGMGGIMNAEDAMEFILAGASAVAVGTANFHNPYATEEIAAGIENYMRRHQIEDCLLYTSFGRRSGVFRPGCPI